MPNRFANGVRAIAMCDRCGQQYKLKQLKTEIIKQRKYQLLVCEECWDPDHPQLMLGTFPVEDPQALRNPRKDNTYITAGTNGLQDNLVGFAGYPTGGSRDIQWGWHPVGGASYFDAAMTPNYLVASSYVGDVTITLDSIPGPSLFGVSATGAVGNALGPLAITGVQATGQVGGVGNIDVFLSGVATNTTAGTPIQNAAVSVNVPGATIRYINNSWIVRVYWNTVSNQTLIYQLAAQLANCGNGQVWLYSDAVYGGTFGVVPPAPGVEQCFGRLTSVTVFPTYGHADFYVDSSILPVPLAQLGDWNVYSYIKTKVQYSVPCPNNGNPVFTVPPYDGYNPTYVNNGATCTLTWTGNAAATLYSTYQVSNSIVHTLAHARWSDTPYYQPSITMGTVTGVSYDGNAFTITMNTETAVSPSTLYPITPISFIPINPGVAYLPSGVEATPAIASVGKNITTFVATPGQNVQFQSGFASGYLIDVYWRDPSTPLGNWIASYGNSYTSAYMFADIGGTYTALGYLPSDWHLTFGQGNSLYYEGRVNDPIPSTFPGLGFYSFNNFVVAAQYYILLELAGQYSSYSIVGGVATFNWTGGVGATMRDTYAQYPTLPVGTVISAIISYQDINIPYTTRVQLGTLLSMGYSSGTFSMTYTSSYTFTPAHNPHQYGDTWFASGITFLPLTINV